MRRDSLLALVVLLLLLFCHSACAQSILHIYPGARPAALGDCFVAVADDASACYWNPGGLSFIEKQVDAVGMFTELVPDWGDVYYWYGAAAVKVGTADVVAASISYLTYGEQVYYDEHSVEQARYDATETAVSLAYCRGLWNQVGLGVNLKYINSSLWTEEIVTEGDGTGSGWGVDAGVLYRVDHPISSATGTIALGAAVRHMGPDLDFEGYPENMRPEDYDPSLPTTLALGASYGVADGRIRGGLICAEYEQSLVSEDSNPILHAGMEAYLSLGFMFGVADAQSGVIDRLSGRLGYVHDEDGEVKDISYGFGFGLLSENGLVASLDVASVARAEGLERPWRFCLSLGYDF